jgi:hypothetical protein
MIPATPTAIPDMTGTMAEAAQSLDLGGMQLWDIAPEAIGFWNMFSPQNLVLIWVIIGALVVVLIMSLMFLYRRMFGENEQV